MIKLLYIEQTHQKVHSDRFHMYAWAFISLHLTIFAHPMWKDCSTLHYAQTGVQHCDERSFTPLQIE